MTTTLLIALLILSLYILSGVIRTAKIFIQKSFKNEKYYLADRIVDTLWLDKIYAIVYGKYVDDNDPYNFDSFD